MPFSLNPLDLFTVHYTAECILMTLWVTIYKYTDHGFQELLSLLQGAVEHKRDMPAHGHNTSFRECSTCKLGVNVL